tara:strand:+ start:18350 stop:18742 length:393 start_codon:yes stop_codon:yes gene_type:complete
MTGHKHTDIGLAYLAGYIDGEGCFTVSSGTRIAVSNTYIPGLLKMQERWGGSVRRMSGTNPNARTGWQWQLGGENCRHLLRLLLPYLKEKRDQAELVLEWFAAPPKSLTRSVAKAELSRLKRIDYDYPTS